MFTLTYKCAPVISTLKKLLFQNYRLDKERYKIPSMPHHRTNSKPLLVPPSAKSVSSPSRSLSFSYTSSKRTSSVDKRGASQCQIVWIYQGPPYNGTTPSSAGQTCSRLASRGPPVEREREPQSSRCQDSRASNQA